MRTISQSILIILVTLFSKSVISLDNDQYYKVEHLYSWSNGDVQIWLENGGKHLCSNQTFATRYIMKPESDENGVAGFEEKLSLLLSAKVSGQPVKLRYDCLDDVPIVRVVRF